MRNLVKEKCPIFHRMKCKECLWKDYVGNRCVIFSVADALLLIAKGIQNKSQSVNSFESFWKEFSTFRDKMEKKSASEYGRCREADQLTNGDDLPF